MRTPLIALALVLSLIVLGSQRQAVQAEPRHDVFHLPSTAVKLSDDLYSLGTAIDPQSGKLVQGYAILKHKDEAANNHSHGGSGSVCYSYLASGAKWKTQEDWVMNPSNTQGLNQSQVFSLEQGGVAKWEDATDGVIGNGLGIDVMGPGQSTAAPLAAETSAPDGSNEVYFGSIDSPGVIAVTTVWGIFSGPASQRVLVEWDQVFDQVSFTWSTSGLATAMDFNNIATHEIGHAFGMGHPSNTCTEETMYAYAANGETKKQTLNTGDISGINQLY